MRLAICFDDLIQFGGAERLLLAVHELYPDAPVYTSVASAEWFKKCADLRINLITSFMQKFPGTRLLNRFYGLLGLHALAFESFNLDAFDVVLSISARFAHGIVTKPGTIHICYMNSPGRMFWEPRNYFCHETLFEYGSFANKLFWVLAFPLLSIRRLCDYASAQRVDYFIANALTPKERIKKYYRRESALIYPFVNEVQTAPVAADLSCDDSDYYLVITRLVAWKRVDIAVEACTKIGARLKVIGEGPDKERLRRLAGSNGEIEFVGYATEQEKLTMLLGCKALLATQQEDFGLTALEAAALGKPVLAYRAGGVLETMIEGVTGEFFDIQDAQSLAEVLVKFDASRYVPAECKKQARKFTKQVFMQQVDEYIKKVYDEHHNLNL